jgi:hypothetical protein
MLREFMKLTFITVGAYLVVAHASEVGGLLVKGQTAYSGGVKTLQGR